MSEQTQLWFRDYGVTGGLLLLLFVSLWSLRDKMLGRLNSVEIIMATLNERVTTLAAKPVPPLEQLSFNQTTREELQALKARLDHLEHPARDTKA